MVRRYSPSTPCGENMESVIKVAPRENFQLELWFDDGAHKLFDVSPYLDKGVFQRLKEGGLFKAAYASGGTVCWPGGLDIAPATLYDRSLLLDN